MGPSKVKKQSSKKKYLEAVNLQWTQTLSDRLKEFKTWAQVKGPKTLQPALSYTLDWLSPELLGTGFRMFEISDFEMKAVVPARKTNFDSQFEIHQGLVTNAILELARVFIQRQVPDHFFQIIGSEVTVAKQHQWKNDLTLSLKISDSHLDDFFVQIQKNKNATIEFEVSIDSGKSTSKNKNIEQAQLKLRIQTTDLIA